MWNGLFGMSVRGATQEDMGKKKSSKGRKPGFGSIEHKITSLGERWRARWPCEACQNVENGRWNDKARRAASRGEEPKPRKPPRVQHSFEWRTSRAAAVNDHERVRTDRLAYQLQGWWPTCLEDEYTSGAKLDQQLEGRPLEDFAQRVLTRREGAATTKDDDYRMWHEEVYVEGTESDPDEVAPIPLGLGERFGHRGVRGITRQQIREWMEQTEQRPGRKRGSLISASGVRQRFYLLTRIFQQAIDDEEVDRSPMTGLKPPAPLQGREITGQVRSMTDQRWLPTEKQIQQIVAKTDARTRLAPAFFFAAGARLGEVIALTRGDLEHYGDHRWGVRITRSESERPGRPISDTKTHRSGQGERYLPEWVGEHIETRLADLPEEASARLFPGVRGGAEVISAGVIRKDLKTALESLGMRSLGPQDLRAAGEAHVIRILGRPEAAAWARHGIGVQMRHYVGADQDRAARAVADWSLDDTQGDGQDAPE